MTTARENANTSNGLATASLVVGILAVLISFFLGFGVPFLGFLSGVAAVVLAIVGLNQAKNLGGNGKGKAIAGLILGSLAIIWIILLWLVIGPMIGDVFNTINNSLSGV